MMTDDSERSADKVAEHLAGFVGNSSDLEAEMLKKRLGSSIFIMCLQVQVPT